MDYNTLSQYGSLMGYMDKAKGYDKPKSTKEYMEPVKYRKDLEMITGPLFKL